MSAGSPRTPRRTLLSLARRQGVPVGYPCRGEGVCGKCTVLILDDSDRLHPPDASERALLAHVQASGDERLACLALLRDEVAGPIVLRVGGGTYRLE